jgi:hypothetical protein
MLLLRRALRTPSQHRPAPIRRGRRATGGLLLYFVAVAVPLTAQEPPIDVDLAKAFFAEAETLGRAGADVWGVDLSGPLLFVHPGSRHTVANVPDTLGVLEPRSGVWVGELPSGVGIANTAVDWGGRRWTMVVWPLPYGRLSRGRLMAHEMFHRAQPELGFSGRDASNPHLDTGEGRLLLRLEWRALQAALADSGEARRPAVADALHFRARRHAAFPEGGLEERDLELNEGLAEYTGVRLAIPVNARAGWVVSQLESADVRASSAPVGRSFAYATGPAIGLLLDAGAEDWRIRVDDTTSLGALLAEAYGVTVSPTGDLAGRWGPYDGPRLEEEERDRSVRIAERNARFRERFVSGPTLTLPATARIRYTFNPGDAEPFGEGGTVYGRTEVRDAWGLLRVDSGGALLVREAGRIDHVVVPAPAELGSDPLRGDGWTLELAAGWAVAAGERPGDFLLVAPQAQAP